MKDLLPITSEAEYEAAIKRLETLVEFQPGTAGHSLAMGLADQIEAYETSRGWDLAEPTPTEREQFRREQMGAGELVAA